MNDSSKIILVTGGAGFIGGHFIRQQLQQPNPPIIINLDKLTYAANLDALRDYEHSSHYHFIKGDIVDEGLLATVFSDFSIDTIVHFAAESHVDRSIDSPKAFIETNIIGTFQLLNAALKHHCRFHYISTDEVFGSLAADEQPFNETSHYAPNSPYSASKASADHLVRAYHQTYQLAATISHCSNNYGPYQHQEKFIPTVIKQCLAEQPIPIYGDGSNIRDWLYVTDHCHALNRIIAASKPGETYCIGGHTQLSNSDMALLICQLLNEIKPGSQPYETLLTAVADRPGHDWRYAIATDKIATELAWQPMVTLEQGLRETIDYFIRLSSSPSHR